MTIFALLAAILKITVNHNETFVIDEFGSDVEEMEEA